VAHLLVGGVLVVMSGAATFTAGVARYFASGEIAAYRLFAPAHPGLREKLETPSANVAAPDTTTRTVLSAR